MGRRTTMGWLAAWAALTAQACIWLIPDPPIESQGGSGAGGSQAVGGGGSGEGGQMEGGGGSGGAPACMLCDLNDAPCTTPINKVFMEPTEAVNALNDADRVIPMSLAAAGSDVYAAVRYKPAVVDGPGVPVALPGYWIARLDGDSATNVVKIHECGLPNGTLFTGPISASEGRLHTAQSSPASSNTQSSTVSASIDELGDSCADNAPQTTVLTTADPVDGITPFLFSFDPADPVDSQQIVTNAVLGQQVALLDIDSSESDVTAFLAVGPSGAFGTPKPPNLNVAYSVGVLQADGSAIQWHEFVALEAGGAFPGVLDYDGAVSVDEAGGVWVTGTTDDGSAQRAFVQYRQPTGQAGLTWLGKSGSRGKTIDVRNGHVMVGIDITEPYAVENGTITPSGPRDFVLLHFVAQTFIDDTAEPDWMYPDPTAAHDASGDDTIKEIQLADVGGCGTVMYGLACLGNDCDAHDGGSVLMMAFDPSGRSLRWGRAIEPNAGSLVPRTLTVAPDGIWIGAELKGTAFGRQSKMFGSGELAGSAWFLKFPL